MRGNKAKGLRNLLFIGSLQLAARTQRSLALVKSLGGLVEATNLTLVDEADLEDLLDGRVDAHGARQRRQPRVHLLQCHKNCINLSYAAWAITDLHEHCLWGKI